MWRPGRGGSWPSAARNRCAALRPPPPRRRIAGNHRARSGGGYAPAPTLRPLAGYGEIHGTRTAGKDGAPAFFGPDALPGRKLALDAERAGAARGFATFNLPDKPSDALKKETSPRYENKCAKLVNLFLQT